MQLYRRMVHYCSDLITKFIHPHLRGPYVPSGVTFECGEGCNSHSCVRTQNTHISQSSKKATRLNVTNTMERKSVMGLLLTMLAAFQPFLVHSCIACVILINQSRAESVLLLECVGNAIEHRQETAELFRRHGAPLLPNLPMPHMLPAHRCTRHRASN